MKTIGSVISGSVISGQKPEARLVLLGEASRYETLAARAALKAVTGDPANCLANVQIARDHALRAETYKAAADLING